MEFNFADGSFVYFSPAEATTEIFQYTISDDNGSSTAEVTIDVSGPPLVETEPTVALLSDGDDMLFATPSEEMAAVQLPPVLNDEFAGVTTLFELEMSDPALTIG